MDPSWTVKSNDGSHLAAYELGGTGEVLLIAHATGLCGAMYQLLGRICQRWSLSTWEEIAPLAISRGYAAPAPKQNTRSRQNWNA